jgi:hypothetical protein
VSRSLCIRSCGRRRTKPGWLCEVCRARELVRLFGRGLRLSARQRFWYGLPSRNKWGDGMKQESRTKQQRARGTKSVPRGRAQVGAQKKQVKAF